MGKGHYIIPIFIPHKGCPFDCVFCNQKKITGLEKEPTGTSVAQLIKDYYETIPNREKAWVEIAFFGGSFTGIDILKQEELLKEANEWKKKGFVKDIRISTRPDYIDAKILENLVKYGVTIIELGVQSMDEVVLLNSGRGHTSKDVKKAVQIIRGYRFKLGLQMMLGLPGDSKEKLLATAKELIKLKPDFVRIYPTLIIKDTDLEELYLKEKYQPLSLPRAVELAKEVLLEFMKYRIPVIRIGLQPTDDLASGSVVAGPFHPSFRQLVESSIVKDFLNRIFINNNIENYEETLYIEGNNKLISNIVGQNKVNIIFLKNQFNIKHIKVVPNNLLPRDAIKIIIDHKELLYHLYDDLHKDISMGKRRGFQ